MSATPIAGLPTGGRVHFVGIGGIGMSGLARILRHWGYAVSGSDAVESDQTLALAAEGIPVAIGHGDLSFAARADLVVATAAVRADNPELIAAQTAGVRVVKRAALLGMLANARRCVAVAGSHGKSTTSGMLVTALRALGADPSYAIGAIVVATGTNAAPGDGAAMVVEADEYDWSFLQLTPDIAIVTNVDYDHPDLFPDQAAYDRAFTQFIARIRPGGTLVRAADDAGCARVGAAIPPGVSVTTFGEAGDPDWRLRHDRAETTVAGGTGDTIRLDLRVPGTHNARNAVAALAALVALGHPPADAATALATFSGVGRRFDLKGEAGGVTVVDEYAHHPREIAASLQATRERYPDRRVWAVFQPHTYSRTKALLADFAAALGDADRIVLLQIYAARETDTLGISTADLLALLPATTIVTETPIDTAELLASLVESGDVVLTLGAGTVTATGALLLDHLGGRLTAGARR